VKSPRKILVFRQSSLGDIILTLPVVKVLRENYPRAVIDYFTKQPYEPIVKYNPALRNIYSFNNNDDFQKRLKQVRAEKYDLIIDLQRNFRSLALSLFNPLAKRVKYKKRRLAREMIVRKPSAKLSVDHTINAYFHTLRKLGIESEPSPPEIFLSDDAREFAEEFIAKSFGKTPPDIIALCPGARHPEKMWPWENFKSVAEILLRDESLGLLVVSAPGDSIPENLDISSPRLVPARDFEILRVAALLSRCRTALTNDSGLMHLANAAGTVFCSPCSLHGEKPCCQPQKYCFENIDPPQVADIVKNII
jgi:ADP-heptose:LPS heptosyltransferase